MSRREISRREFLRLASVASAGMALAACAPAGTPPPTAPPAAQPTEVPAAATTIPEAAPTVITWLSHWGDPDTLKYWQGVADQFQNDNPGNKVDLLTVDRQELLTKFMTLHGAGSAPDVYHLSYDFLPDLLASNTLNPPGEEISQEIKEGWSDAGISGMSQDGKVWGYPTEVGLRGLIYNSSMLEGAGIAAPPTEGFSFDEFAEACKKATTDTVKGTGLLVQYETGVYDNFVNYLWNAGGEFTNTDNTKVLFNSPEGVDALSFLKSLIDAKSVALVSSADMAQGLATETVAMFSDANWWKLMFFDTFDESHGKGAAQKVFKVSGVPWRKAKKSRAYTYGLSVSAQSKAPETAWKFSRYIGAPRAPDKNSHMAEFLTSFWGIIPANKLDQQISSGMNEPYTAAYVELLNTQARIQPVFKGYAEIQHTVAVAVEAVYVSGKDPQAALEEAAKAADAILAG